MKIRAVRTAQCPDRMKIARRERRFPRNSMAGDAAELAAFGREAARVERCAQAFNR
jgi:hypothetical protein